MTFAAVGTCEVDFNDTGNSSYDAATQVQQSFSVGKGTPSAPSISNLPASGTYGGGFTATVSTTGDGVQSVTSSTPSVCTASGLAVSYVGVGTCTLTAHVAAGTNYNAADGSPQSFSVGKGTPSAPSISNLPASGTYGGGFTATVSTTGDGVQSVTSSTPSICTASGLAVSYVGVGTCTLTAHVAAGTNYNAADGSPQSFSVGKGTPSAPSISNLPASGTYGGGFTATVSTTGDGVQSVTSSTPSVCTASGLAVSYVGVGTCTLTAHVAAGTNYNAADGSPQSFSVGGAALSVTANDASITYGGALPTLTATFGGLVNGDTQASENGWPGAPRPGDSPPGTYAITACRLIQPTRRSPTRGHADHQPGGHVGRTTRPDHLRRHLPDARATSGGLVNGDTRPARTRWCAPRSRQLAGGHLHDHCGH